MNRWKFRRNTSRLMLVLASLLALIFVVMTGMSSYAITPDGAYIGKIQGTGLTIGARNSRDRTRASEKQELRPNTILYVPGNRSWANLGFFEDSPKDSTGLLIQAGPSAMTSEWSFPCSAKGRLTINWKKGERRGCEEGIQVKSSSKRGGLPNNNLQASRRLLAQAEDEVTVVPTPGESLLQTADNAAGISINVLVGDVRVKSVKNPGGRLVKAGERYDYPQDTITPIDPNPILNSPEMQDFLNPNNWRSPDIPQRVADGIAGQLEEVRIALSQLPPSQSQIVWNLDYPSRVHDGRTCSRTRRANLPIVQTAASLNGRMPVSSGDITGYLTITGSITEGRVQMETTTFPDGVYDFSMVFNGAKNQSDEIVGTATTIGGGPCGGLSDYFKMTRQSSQASAQNNYCSSRTVTQPTISSNSHDGTPYRIWMDFSRGQEVSSAVCGRQYWVKEDPNHPNYQIHFIYLVDGKGKCVVPYLYKETNDGNLEVVRAAPECSSGSQISSDIYP